MTADKRKVSTDALETLGMKIGPEEKRDAIHLAVIPVQAGQKLSPGAHVGIDADGMAYSGSVKEIGIVDPFLESRLQKGDWFWLVIYPRQITSLRHVWTHPDIPDCDPAASSASRAASENWLRAFVEEKDGPDYDTMIQTALESDSSDSLFFGTDIYGDIPPEFWNHVEVVTGKKIPEENRAKYFQCAC